jgi:hypothetical protein
MAQWSIRGRDAIRGRMASVGERLPRCSVPIPLSMWLTDGYAFQRTRPRAVTRQSPLITVWFGVQVPPGPPRAGVAELVDALGLGSSGASCGGSSPSARTINSLHHTPPSADAGEDEDEDEDEDEASLQPPHRLNLHAG